MKAMAVDYGDARTGVAVSDISRTLVGEAWVIHSKKMQETAEKLVCEARIRNVSCIIIGYPKNMDGSIGARAEKSRMLAEKIRTLLGDTETIDVQLRDERLTTKDAHRILSDAGKSGRKRKQTIDAVAAALILESYLDSRRT